MAVFEQGRAREDVKPGRIQRAVQPATLPRWLRYVLWPLGDLGAGALAFLAALLMRYGLAPALSSHLRIAAPRPHLYTAAFCALNLSKYT